MTRIAVVGAGHFGKEHARVYSSCDRAKLVAVCDIDERAGAPLAARLGVDFVRDFRDIKGSVDAISLAVPTGLHSEIACDFLKSGVSVLVEKPMAITLDEAGEMIDAASSSGAVLQVGHLERFNPAVIAAREIAAAPRFFEAHRLSVFTPRSLDIDVVMDLMIHDIDIVLSLAGSQVAEVRAAGIPVITPHIDIANARIEFENGCIANLTASRVSGEQVRKIRFFQPRQYVSIDYTAQEAATVSVDGSRVAGPPGFSSRLLPVEKNEPLRLELESFLNAVQGGPVQVPGEEGRRALELAIQVTRKIREHWSRTGQCPDSSQTN